MRGRKPLSLEQKARLKQVADADDAWRRAKKYEYERARQAAEERIQQFGYVRDTAVYEAVRSGVPKAVVGRDGLGTTNPYAVNEAYQRIVDQVAETGVEPSGTPVQRFSWGDILNADSNWVFGWVIDVENPVRTSAPASIDDSGEHDGFFVTVDRFDGVVTALHTPDGVLTKADPGWEDIREWAANVTLDEVGGEK